MDREEAHRLCPRAFHHQEVKETSNTQRRTEKITSEVGENFLKCRAKKYFTFCSNAPQMPIG